MPEVLPPIPFPSTPAVRWLLAQTPALERIREERAREFRSEADAARNGGAGCPTDDQQVMEFES